MSKDDEGFHRCREYTPWQISSGWYEDKVDNANLMVLSGVIGVTYLFYRAKWQGVNGEGNYFDKEAWRRFYQESFRGEKANTSHNNQSNFKETPPKGPNYLRSQHYTVLGLSRTRTLAYTDDEIKRAFRAKAKEVHPDQNPDDAKAAEKFKKLMRSYESILSERKSKR